MTDLQKSAKTTEAFESLAADNGFEVVAKVTSTGDPIFQREWTKKVQTRRNEWEETLGFRVCYNNGAPLVTINRNGQVGPHLVRFYTSPKRAFNAMRTIARNEGYTW